MTETTSTADWRLDVGGERPGFDAMQAVGANGPWCQPGNVAERQWVLWFEDPDRGIALFSSEQEARAAYEAANQSWNCYLLVAAPRQAATL